MKTYSEIVDYVARKHANFELQYGRVRQLPDLSLLGYIYNKTILQVHQDVNNRYKMYKQQFRDEKAGL